MIPKKILTRIPHSSQVCVPFKYDESTFRVYVKIESCRSYAGYPLFQYLVSQCNDVCCYETLAFGLTSSNHNNVKFWHGHLYCCPVTSV